jgi:hypothetical protein
MASHSVRFCSLTPAAGLVLPAGWWLAGSGFCRFAGSEKRATLMAARAVTDSTAKVAQCFAAKNGARQRGRAPGAEKKQAAESGAALHGFIYALHNPPLSLSLLYSYPQAPPDSPLKVALLCLPCLLLSSSPFPCKRTNNKKSLAFKSARSFSLHFSYSRS